MNLTNEDRISLKKTMTIIAVLVLSAIFALCNVNNDNATFAIKCSVVIGFSIFCTVAIRGINKILRQANTSTQKIFINLIRSRLPWFFEWFEQKSLKRWKAFRDLERSKL